MLKQLFDVIRYILEPITKVISSIVNFILLAIIYYIGIGPVSIIMKLFGKHFLDIKSYRNRVSGELKTDKSKAFVVQKITKEFSRNKKFLSKQNRKSNWYEHKVTKQALEDYYKTF